MRRAVLENWLEEFLNVEAVSDHLPNGLQIEGTGEVKKVLTAVSINLDVVRAALNEGADTIIVHHGMFWNNEQRTIKGYRRKRILQILNGNINLFAYHLPLDLHPEISHNRMILAKLDAQVPQEEGEKRIQFGLKGLLKCPCSFEELVKRINLALDAESRFFHYGKSTIGSLLVVSGAGRNLIDTVSELDVDAYLTGDAAENTEYIAREEGLNYIFAGHYNTEKPGIIELGRRVEQEFGIPVRFFDSRNPL
jgi:dinuclear metal center YbgI/SA1388 family protein